MLKRSLVPLLFVLLCCSACGDQQFGAAQSPSSPASTAGASRPTPRPRPTIARQPAVMTQPSSVPTPPSISFAYLWPSYLPSGLQLSASESQIDRPEEVGAAGLGFYIFTFSNGSSKIIIGGGAVDHFLLPGVDRRLTIGSRPATLTTAPNNNQRQIIFDQRQGQLFLFGTNVSEADLLHVAESLQPLSPTEARRRLPQSSGGSAS